MGMASLNEFRADLEASEARALEQLPGLDPGTIDHYFTLLHLGAVRAALKKLTALEKGELSHHADDDATAGQDPAQPDQPPQTV
jgi:hypothetical protein